MLHNGKLLGDCRLADAMFLGSARKILQLNQVAKDL